MSDRRTVAIVGASGFIGSRLAEWLLLQNCATVRPITRSFKGHARLARFVVDSRTADATQQQALEPHLRDCDVVYHCVVGDHDTIVASLEATYRAAAAVGVRRLVYLSSAVVHGHAPAPGTNEDSLLVENQRFSYNVSKVVAERRLAKLRQDCRVETVVLRPCIVFGPRSQWWTAQIATQLIAGTAYLFEDGSGVCNTLYVDNLAHAMWLAAIRSEAANQTFLITDGERVTWRQLYESVAAALAMGLGGVHSVDAGMVERIGRDEDRKLRMARIRYSVPAQVARALLPQRSKDALRRLVDRAPAPSVNGMGRPQPAVDREVAGLQSCRVVLPIDRARALLGYDPTIGFAEAAERTGRWIRFAFGLSAQVGNR